MSYLLQFPSLLLPPNVRSPPYVVFGINGKDVVADLPARIPLNVVLHFAPKLKQWLLPPPSMSDLPQSMAKLMLHTPHIGIDIPSDDIEALGLKWIISKMLQVSGLAYPKSLFLIYPTIQASASIHKTWIALDLPLAGIQALHTHIQTGITLGPAVTLPEMKSAWKNFPHGSEIVRAMGVNFIRSHINFEYTPLECCAMRKWYLKSGERSMFFLSLENQFRQFGEVEQMDLDANREKTAGDCAKKASSRLEELVTNGHRVLERAVSRKVSPEEKKERHFKDTAAIQTKLRRTKSEESVCSVETAIWDPLTPKEQREGVADGMGDKDVTSSESNDSVTGPKVHNKIQFSRAKRKRPLSPQSKAQTQQSHEAEIGEQAVQRPARAEAKFPPSSQWFMQKYSISKKKSRQEEPEVDSKKPGWWRKRAVMQDASHGSKTDDAGLARELEILEFI